MKTTITVTFDRFKHQWPGYRDVLRSEAVRADLQTRADEVARSVRGRLPTGYQSRGVYIIADTIVGRNRAGATIIGVPMRLEKKYRILGSALGVSGAVAPTASRKRKASTRARNPVTGRFV